MPRDKTVGRGRNDRKPQIELCFVHARKKPKGLARNRRDRCSGGAEMAVRPPEACGSVGGGRDEPRRDGANE